MTTALAWTTATGLLEAYRAGELSPVEATEAALQRIELHDPAVNAYCLVDRERALADARGSEARRRRGEPLGRLDGVPVAVKDVFLTSGWPTLRGSRAIDPAQVWDVDAPAVARLREHGAVLLGKTTTPELAWKGVTDSPLTGVTRNPWDPGRTAGGSSGGSAAAVALGMAPLALGTDGGGSIRIPAAFCGIVGFKPTYGRISLWPPSPFGTLAHAGPMARTVADAALMLDVIAAPDVRDWTALPPSETEFAPGLDRGVEGMRIAFSPRLGYVEVEPEVEAAVEGAAQAFVELGAAVEEADPGFADPLELFDVLWHAGAAMAVEAFPDRRDLDPGLAEIAELGRRTSLLEYLGARARRAELGARMGAFHERYRLLLTPSVPITAFAAGREVPEGWPHERWTSWTPFTYPFNLSQQPAASVPCGFDTDGLPIGLQIVGAKYDDLAVLRAAHSYEAASHFADRRPA